MATSSINSQIRIVDTESVDVFAEALSKADVSRKSANTVKLSAKTRKSYDSFIKSVKK